MNKKFFLWLFVFLVLVSIVSAVPTGGESFYDLFTTTDSWGSFDLTNYGVSSSGSYPSFLVSGDAGSSSGYFDGTDYMVSDSSAAALDSSGDLSIALWFYIDDLSSYNYLVGRTGASGNRGFSTRVNPDGSIEFDNWASTDSLIDSTLSSSSVISQDNWYCAVFSRTDGNQSIFVNNVNVAETSYSMGTSWQVSSYYASLGEGFSTGGNGAASFSGYMDYVQVFNKGLNVTEINNFCNYGDIEYEPPVFSYPYEVTDIVFSPVTVYPVDDISATVTLNDSVGADVRYYWLVNDVNITSGTVSTSSGDDFSIPSLDSSNYGSGDTIKLDVFAVYESNSSQASDSYFETISTTNVSIISLSISPSTVYTDTDVSGSVTFDYGDSVVAFYEWIVNDVVVDSNYYSTIGSTYTIPSLSSSNFVQGDNVTLNVTPYKGSSEAIGLESSVYKIVTNRDPFFYNAFAVPSVLVEDTGFDFACYFGDSDSDTLSIDWTLYRNDVEFDSSNDTATNFGSGIQGIVTSVTGVNSVEDDEWYIDCQAFDGYGGSTVIESSSVYTVEAILNWSVTASDHWNSNSISDFWLYLDGVNYTTTSGIIITDVLRNDGELHNYSIGSHDYLYIYDYEDVYITTNFDRSFVQSNIIFDTYDVNGNLLASDSSINYFVTDGLNSDTLYGHQSFGLSAGNYNVTAFKDGYFNNTISFNVSPLDVKTVDITGFYDSIVTFSPVNTNNDSLNVFNGWLSNVDGSYNVSFSSTNGSASVPYLNDTVFYYGVSVDGYASEYGFSTTNSTYFTLSTTHYTFNSVRINIYNGTSSNLLTQLVTVVGIFDDDSLVNSTSNGSIIIDFLTPEDYELRFNSSGFVNTTVFISVTNDSTQEVNVHMISSSGLELQRFLVVDQISDVVSGAVIRLQEQVPGVDGLWVTVDEKSTNSDGYAGFYVTKSTNTFYRMIVVYDGVVKLISDATLFLPGIDEVITLQINTLSVSDVNLYDSIVKTFVWSGDSNETFTYSWIDPNNFISGARLEVWVEDLNITGVPPQLYIVDSSSLTTGSLDVTLPVVNNTIFTVKAYIIYSGYDELVYVNNRLFGSSVLPDKDLGLILSLIVFLFVAFITISLKPLFSSVLSFSVLGILTAFHLIVLPVTVITSFIALAIIFFIKIKRGGN